MSPFEDFCGGPIWNSSVTWNTTDPDFTECFHKSVLSWTPGLPLLLLGPYEAYQYTRSPNRNIPFNIYNLTKVALTIAAVAVSLVEVSLTATAETTPPDIEYVTPVVFATFFLISLLLLLLSLKYGVQTSATQFFYYTLAVICGAPILRYAF
jgi:ATP-binding cassette subfamily C (CFTR/MRP) protein 1